MTSHPSTCKGCNAKIRWVRLNARWHPAELEDKQIIFNGELVRGPESHYAHCPNADAFRKSKRG